MKTFYTTFTLAATASAAAVLPRGDSTCCFQLTATGGQSGTVGQLSDGQNRIGGGNNPTGTYCLDTSASAGGTITDGAGRGCILTPPTTQLQCDVGAQPYSGFSINGQGELLHNGSSVFYACAASETEYNIYTETSDAETKCSEIELHTNGRCEGAGESTTSAAHVTTTATSAATYKTSAAETSAATCAPPVTMTVVLTVTMPAKTVTITDMKTMTMVPTESVTVSATCESQGVSKPMPVESASGSWVPPPPASMATPPAQSMPSVPPKPLTSAPAGSPPASMHSAPATMPHGSALPPPAESTSKVSMPAPAVTMPAVSSAPAAPPKGTPAASIPTAATSVGASACPASLDAGAYQTPHLIVPINSQQPDTSYGTQYNGYLSSSNSTLVSFDIPDSYAGKICSLIFLLPNHAELETSAYTFNGQGSIDFALLAGPATEETSYATCPGKKAGLGSVMPKEGGAYVVSSASCAAGETQTVLMGSGEGLELEWFEDWNPSPLGVFISVC